MTDRDPFRLPDTIVGSRPDLPLRDDGGRYFCVAVRSHAQVSADALENRSRRGKWPYPGPPVALTEDESERAYREARNRGDCGVPNCFVCRHETARREGAKRA